MSAQTDAGPDWREQVFEVFRRNAIRQVAYVPDAGHAALIRMAHADPDMRAYPLTTEEEGVAAVCGAWLGGQRAALLMQSSGVGGLGASPGFARTGLFRLHMEGPTGLAFNFGDNPETPRATPALMWLARRFGNPIDAWTIGRVASVTGTGVLWFEPPRGGPARLGIPRVARFGRVEAATLRDAWEEKGARFVALKAGDNAANHSNLDIGSFVLDAGGERFAGLLCQKTATNANHQSTHDQPTEWLTCPWNQDDADQASGRQWE